MVPARLGTGRWGRQFCRDMSLGRRPMMILQIPIHILTGRESFLGGAGVRNQDSYHSGSKIGSGVQSAMRQEEEEEVISTGGSWGRGIWKMRKGNIWEMMEAKGKEGGGRTEMLGTAIAYHAEQQNQNCESNQQSKYTPKVCVIAM